MSGWRGMKCDSSILDGGRLYYNIKSQDSWKYELYVTPDDIVQYEAKVSTGWSEKQRQEYFDLELSKKTSALEFYEDLKIIKERGVSFEDSEKLLITKYSPLTLYRTQKNIHYLEGVLSAQPEVLSETSKTNRDVVDYCVSLELSQIKNDGGQKNIKAILTVNTGWNFLKKK